MNPRLTAMAPSATMAINSRAKELQAKGVDIINLTVGELSFPTPEHIVKTTKDALDEGKTKYGPIRGIPELRQVVAEKSFAPMDNVIIQVGAKQALFNVFQTIIDPTKEEKDEVIVFAPYWVSYPAFVKLAGGEPRYLQLSPSIDYQIDVETVRNAITPNTKAILVNSPSNPTGSVQRQEILDNLWQLCQTKGIYLIVDEIYKNMIFEKERSILRFQPSGKLIIVDGVSKSHSMTGFRIGWTIANKEVIDNIAKLQSHSTASPTTFCQYAAFEALTGVKTDLRPLLEENRKEVVRLFNEIEGVECGEIDSAFYAFPSFRGYVGKKVEEGRYLSNSRDLAEYLLKEAKVATVPGEDFGADWHLRVNFAVEKDTLIEAVKRIKEALGKLNAD